MEHKNLHKSGQHRTENSMIIIHMIFFQCDAAATEALGHLSKALAEETRTDNSVARRALLLTNGNQNLDVKQHNP